MGKPCPESKNAPDRKGMLACWIAWAASINRTQPEVLLCILRTCLLLADPAIRVTASEVRQ